MRTSRIPDIKSVRFRDTKAHARAILQQLEETATHPKQEVVVCSLPIDQCAALADVYEQFNEACIKNDSERIALLGAQLTSLWQYALDNHFVTVVERSINVSRREVEKRRNCQV